MKERNETNKPTKTGSWMPHHIKKSLIKKVIPYILVGCIASSAVMMAYTEAEEVKAEAISITALTVGALLAVMATMGITYATQNILETWEDGNNALDPDYEDIYETWKKNYNAEWKVLEGSGGDNNDDLPPDFDALMKQIEIAGNTAVITVSAWELLKKSGKTLFQKSHELGTLFAESTIPDGMNVDLSYVDLSTLGIFYSPTAYNFTNYGDANNVILKGDIAICFDAEGGLYHMVSKTPAITYTFQTLYFNKSGEFLRVLNGQYIGGYITDSLDYNQHTIYRTGIRASSRMSRFPTFNTQEESFNYMKQFIDKKIGKQNEPIWVTPELQETYENNGQFEFPENVPNPLRVPNIGDLQELARRLNPESNPDYNPEEVPEYIKQYINDLKVDPNPDPDPNPNPNPNPDPDNPDNPVNPDNPDNPTNNDTFLADLKHLFPFCVPFDLVDCFKLFNAEPVTPRVEFPVHFGIVNYDHTFVIDLKDFNNVAVVCRSTFLIIYITGLILATRALIKG